MAIRVQEVVTSGAVLTSTLLRSKLPLHRHICRQLRHKHTSREDTLSSSVLKQKVIQGGSWTAHSVWSRSGADSLDCCRYMTSNTSWLCVFPSHCDCVPYPKHSPSSLRLTCFISCNRHLPLHILWRGVVRQRGNASSADAAGHSLRSQTGTPPKVWWVSIKQDLFEIETLCFSMDSSLHRQSYLIHLLELHLNYITFDLWLIFFTL